MLAAVASLASVPAEAVTIGRSASFSRPASTFKAPSISDPSRVGGGSNVGVAKPDVMAKARGTSTVPAPSYQQNYQTPLPLTNQNNGSGFGSSFAGSLGGSLLGSVIGNSISRPSTTVVTQPAGTTAYAAPAGAPVVYTTSGYGVFSFLGDLVLLILAGAGIYFAYRWIKNRNTPANVISKFTGSTTSSNPEFSAKSIPGMFTATESKADNSMVTKFLQIQTAFAMHRREALAGLVTAELLQQLIFAGSPAPANIKNVSYYEVDSWKDKKSVRFQALDLTTAQAIDEVWHFTLVDNQWMLEGIEQV